MTEDPTDRPVPGDNRFETVADASVDGLLVIDADGIVQYANPAAVAMFAEQTGNLVGFHFGTPAVREPTELQFLQKGKIRYVEIRASAFLWNDREATLASLRDITERKQAENALRESEELLSRSQKIANIGSWKLDLTTHRLTWSDEVYSMFGCKPQEFAPTYEAFLDFTHPDDRGAVDEAYFRSVREGIGGYEIEHRIVRRNSGEVRHVHERCVHERDAAGAIIQSIGMIQDITERKRAETYHEMGRKVLQILNEPGSLRESIQGVLATLKTRTGFDAVGLRLQAGEDYPYFAQDGFPEDFLLTENTLVERGKDGGVCRGKDGNVSLECTCGLVISGKTDPANQLFTQGGSCWTNDSFPLLDLPSDQDPRLHPRNNCIHQGYASVALIPVRTKDGIVGLLQLNDKRKGRFTLETIQILEGIAAHIGSTLMRKRAEDALQKALDRVEAIFAALHDAIFVVDAGTRQIVKCNRAAGKMFGYNYDEIIGENTTFLHVDQEHFEKFGRAFIAAYADLGYYETEFEMRRQDGSVFPTEHFVRPVHDSNGQFVYLVSVVRDISNRKHLQAQLIQAQKMESIGRLAGGVAHDLNNMLQAILGYSEMALEQVGPDTHLCANLEGIRNVTRRSADLMRQLLAFARKQTIAPKVLDLNDAVAGMLKMLRRLIGEDIGLLWVPGAKLWPVKLDPGQLDQILANLCVNARDAIGGVGKLTIETENVSIDADYCKEHAEAVIGSYVRLAVSDDGSGMDQEALAQLFEPFFTTKGVGEGTGLGLATVYGIVKQNEGFVKVNSEPRKGTTFRIYLPRFGGEHSGRQEARTTEERLGGSETVMLVEDEKSVLVTTAQFLDQLGYTVLTAETPSAAMRLAAEHEGAIELLIADVVMPGMNGRDLAAKLTEKDPRMKCLFISGYTSNVIAHRGILDEGVHFLSKPFTREDIARKVRELLKGESPTSKE